MRPLLLLAGLSVVAAGGCGAPSGPSAAPEHPAPLLSLRPGLVAEAALAGGEQQVYRLDVPSGWFAELAVEQQGIDAAVSLEDPAGRLLTEIDSPNGANGPEPLLLLGGTQPVRLIIAATDPRAPSGRYAIRVAALRQATERDRARVAAERTFEQGERLRRQGDGAALRKAVAEHRRALAAFGSLRERRREAGALDRLGRLHLLLGEAPAAREAYREAISRLRELDARQPLVDALNGAGKASRYLGRPAEALACYREALEIQGSLGDRVSAGITWNNIGKVHATQGDAEAAFEAYDKALAIWRDLKEEGEAGITLGNRGRLYGFLGETGRARNALQQASLQLEAAGRLADAAAALADLGLILALSGQPRDGLASLQRALTLQQRAGDRNGEASTLNSAGWIHLRSGEHPAAQKYLQRALSLYEEMGGSLGRAVVLANLGQLAARQSRPRDALALYDRALPLLAEAGDRDQKASVLLDRARAWRQLGDLERARQSAEEALAWAETLRAAPGAGELRASFLASRQEIHELLIDLLLDLHRRQPAGGHAEAALAASERARARSLLDRLAGPAADPDPTLLSQELEAGRRLATAERHHRRLAAEDAPAARQAAARAEVEELLREMERLESRISGGTPEADRLLTAADIQREVVGPGTLLLEYFLGESRSFLWAASSGRLEVFELAPRARLEEAARSAHALLAAEDRTLAGPQAEAALAELSRLLLAPVEDRLAGRRLLIVPDGALGYVPFAALPGTGGTPLVEDHEIAVLPSASALAALRRRTRSTPPGLVAVVADPVFEPDDPRIAGRRDLPPRTVARGSDPAAGLVRLPFSREEAEAILLLAPAGRRFAALDFAASRATVTGGVLSGYRIVHFATHGVIDPERPALSGLALSRMDEQGRRREGFLRAHEIRHLRLPADLVVLSACRTALGREVRGEGLLGLTQSFFQAGARRVVVSLWPVDDRATAQLMTRFYRAMLAEGQSPAAALRTAQRSLRREPPFHSPAFWAGFVLQGDL